MSSSEPAFDPDHPLLRDRPRLEALKNKMFALACSRLGFPANPGDRSSLPGGESPEDVVSIALRELLAKPSDYTTTWEALGMTIVNRRSIDAVRRAVAGRREGPEAKNDPDAPDTIDLVPIDNPMSQNELDRLSIDACLESASDPAEMVMEAERQQALWAIANETLSPRDLEIFRLSHFEGLAPPAIAQQANLTPRRVQQLVVEIERKLAATAHDDDRFPDRSPDEGALPQKGEDQ